ncbi:Oligosaccharyltransferase subunit Ribophorin II-domain-containing protein [Plectosphaerella plurivora]|uniref:Oligosaccharyltransferase subunit Ribophorin II-domain-containing protein n=1 Tax=Plectosphaerella plurivora TaxID=936078 RepID=A0A9P9A8V7_9PEZI|nr:Oligosaccharyltransferase subunit Ribophorin II-domain-containing protein [Plectosphaerella plurivora]
MRLLTSILPALALAASGVSAASSWAFSDATVTRVSKTEGDVKQPLVATTPLKSALSLGAKDSIKIVLTAKESGKAKRPHQAFLVLRETADTPGLDVHFPLTLKDNGKGVVEIAQKDLPVQHSVSSGPLSARIVIGSFGAAQALETAGLFEINVTLADDRAAQKNDPPLRYGKREEIVHQFRPPPQTPPKVISIFFALAVLATFPAVLIAWAALGGNVSDAAKSFSSAPLSHALFFGSLVAMEGALFLYHVQWRLFQFLPVAGVISVVAFVSGSKALGEIQGRRLAGQR